MCDAVKFSDTLDEETISKLCDCGRHKKKFPQIARKKNHEPLETAYGATFREHPEVRPRSSKRPPPSPRDTNPPPMSFVTNQRSQFRPFRNVEKAKLMRQEETYQPPSGRMEFDTNYGREFIFKETEPSNRRVAGPSDTREAVSGPMLSLTTAREHFKQWVAQPQMAFQELPSFAGSVLYPDKTPLPESTSRNSYKGKYVPPLDTAKAAAAATNIVIEGEMDLGTTAREAYKGFPGHHRAVPANPRSRINNYPKGRFNGETQTRHDYGGFKNGIQPSPPKPIDPPLPCIDLTFDNRRCFDTEQRATFRGHDIRQHPASESCKRDKENYQPPTVTFETQTSHRRDYMPIDLDSAFTARATKPEPKIHQGDSKFEGTTMNKVFFRNWGPQVKSRPRYGDFHESHSYIPSAEPFSGESTTRRTYTPKRSEATKNYKPDNKPKQMIGNFDFDTEYRLSYISKKAPICKAQAYLMERELKRRQGIPKAPMASGKVLSVGL